EKGYNKGYEDGCKGLYNLSVTEAKSDNLYEKEILKSSYEKGYYKYRCSYTCRSNVNNKF
ncbi:hypothetical protein ACTPEM_26055, partial [Clostridioides difficile]